jgi:hypothetical protein
MLTRVAIVLALPLLLAVIVGCQTISNVRSSDTAVSELRNDLTTPVTVSSCTDARCTALAGSVTDRVAPGQFLPVNVAVDVSESYQVRPAGGPTRCLRINQHPANVRPTVLMSAAVHCSALPSETSPGVLAATVGWAFLLLVVVVLGLIAMLTVGLAARDTCRRLAKRPTNQLVAVAGAVLAGGYAPRSQWVACVCRESRPSWSSH